MATGVSCPVCLAKVEASPVEVHGEFALYQCPDCELTFSDPMMAADAAWYDRAYVVRHLAVDDRIREHYRVAAAALDVGSKLLDIGCGEGAFVDYARRRGLCAYGIDISAKAVEAGRRRYGLDTLFCGSVSEWQGSGVADNSQFDAVTAFDLLEHVSDPLAFVIQVQELVRPRGLLIFSVPNAPRWPIREFGDHPPQHLTRWTHKALARLGGASDLEVVRIVTTSALGSLNRLLGYPVRYLMYRILGLHGYFGGSTTPVRPRFNVQEGLLTAVLSKVGSPLRRLRDRVLWLPTVVLAPFMLPWVSGGWLVLIARRKR